MIRVLPALLCALPILLAGTAGAQESAPSPSTAVPASGSKVSLAPLRIELEGEQTAETLRIFNPSTEAIGIQVRAFNWSQDEGEDVFAPTNDVGITPGIATIDPGKTQIFRVIRRNMEPKGEQRYRIVIDQLPDPKAKANSVSETRIRFTLPMFVDRAIATPAALAWSIQGNSIAVANSGEQTPRMVNLALTDAVGNDIEVENVALHYIMGGSTLRWTLPGGCPAGPVRLTAMVDGEAVDAQVQPVC